MRPAWYLHRLRCMSIFEIGWRARNKILEHAWRRRVATPWRTPPGSRSAEVRCLPGQLPAPDQATVTALLAAAEDVLAGQWSVFGVPSDLSGADPDWSRNPKTGRATSSGQFCFDIPYRDATRIASVKHVWEVSRLHHVTLLAAAFFLSDDERFASRAVAHLTSWWRKNPPLMGINWVSGIEMGLRLMGWVWTRRLLDRMPGIERIFEANPVFRQQLHAHQSWIATFYSRFSSANNHLIAEMAGSLSAALTFPLFAESEAWAGHAASILEREIQNQTFPDGMNRELASDYHAFVLELLLIAGGEADFAGRPLSNAYWQTLCRMADSLAALIDVLGKTARQGDSDSGRALLLDAPSLSPVTSVLDTCELIFEAAPWWRDREPRGVGACLLAGIVQSRTIPLSDRPAERPSCFPFAGITVLRDLQPGPNELWCRLDHGPHGFLSTAAHAHADALSIELREGGQEILTDPGTYCYQDERHWRDYFRSTLAHNTLEVDGRDQALHAGPFLWLTRPNAGLTAVTSLDAGGVAEIEAWHDGYAAADGRHIHHRRLTLDRTARAVRILDWLEGLSEISARLAFHFHPAIDVVLEGGSAELRWGPLECRRWATMTLPGALEWRMHRGETDPILGWYSPSFGRREPSISVIGAGRLAPHQVLYSRVVFQGSLVQRAHAVREQVAAGIPA